MIKNPSLRVQVMVGPNDDSGPPNGIPAHGYVLFCLRFGDGQEIEIAQAQADLRKAPTNAPTPLASKDLWAVWSLLTNVLSDDELLAAPQRKACRAAIAALKAATKN